MAQSKQKTPAQMVEERRAEAVADGRIIDQHPPAAVDGPVVKPSAKKAGAKKSTAAPARKAPQDRRPKAAAAAPSEDMTAEQRTEYDQAMTELEQINEKTVDVEFEGITFEGCKLEPFNDWRIMEAQATGQWDPKLILGTIVESVGADQYVQLKQAILDKHDGKRIPNEDVMRFFYALSGAVDAGN